MATVKLSEFRNELEGKQYWAELNQEFAEGVGTVYTIQCFIDNVYQGSRTIKGHSLQYAEDAAENFVFGILKLNEAEQV